MNYGAIITGVFVGVIAAPLIGVTAGGVESLYDRLFPVVEARAEVVSKTPKNWQLIMYSRKHRDCPLLEVQAFDSQDDGEVVRLGFVREDGAQTAQMVPGKFRSVVFLLTPAPKQALKLYYLHGCDGRLVRTQVEVSQ